MCACDGSCMGSSILLATTKFSDFVTGNRVKVANGYIGSWPTHRVDDHYRILSWRVNFSGMLI